MATFTLAIWLATGYILAIGDSVYVAIVAGGFSTLNTIVNLLILRSQREHRKISRQALNAAEGVREELSSERGETVYRDVEELPNGDMLIRLTKVKPHDESNPQ